MRLSENVHKAFNREKDRMAFFLRTFGGLQLLDSTKQLVSFPEKGLLLLAYLLTTKERASFRTTLAQLLWSSEDNSVALSNLRKAISRIKKRQAELGVEFLSTTETMISVNTVSLTSDLILNEKEGDFRSFDRLMSFAAMLRQPFLGPVHCQGRDFDQWLSDRRGHDISILRQMLREIAPLAETAQEREIVKDAAIFLFSAEPDNTDTLQLLVGIFNAEGEVERLRAHFEHRNAAISRGNRVLSAALHPEKPKSLSAQSLQTVAVARSNVERVGAAKKLPTAIPRLVLLPPANQSSNPDAGFIAASLIEDITIGFCAFNSLQVIAPHSAVRISLDLNEQATFFETHSVSYVLHTRINQFRDEVTLFVQLVFLDNDEVVWAERFKLETLDLAVDRKVISRHIGRSISSEIERHGDTLSYLELNPTAYHRYLVGRQHLNRLTLPNMRRARREMKSALQASDDFAPALSAIARTYSKEWLLTARGDLDLLKTAESYAAKAIASRPGLADGYREFGVAKLLQGAIDESAEAMDLAETLSPHYADVIADHADTLVHCSRPDIALQKIERAMELNPLSPDAYLWTAAGANYALGKFEDTLKYIDQMADPALADRLSAASWAMLGDSNKARVFVQRTRKANPDFDAKKWLAVIPIKEQWHRDLYKEGLQRAGF